MSLERESEYGVSFILHSDSDKELFKENNASSFENVFKKPIQLSIENEYEICLANIHSPIHQFTLTGMDFDKCHITYNLALFLNRKHKFIRISGPMKLWSSAPDTSFMGLDENDNTRHDMRHRREKFINRLSRSLRLEHDDENGKQAQCLKLYKKLLDKHKQYTNSGLLMATYNDESGILQFDHIPKDLELDRFEVFQEILIACEIFEPDIAPDYLKLNYDTLVDYLVDKHIKDEHKKEKNIYDSFEFNRNGLTPNDLEIEGVNEATEDVGTLDHQEMILGIYITFGERMRHFLSLEDEPIIVHYCGPTLVSPHETNNVKAAPVFVKQKIDSLFIYSDLVKKDIRVGNSMTNLLDIVSVNRNIGNTPTPINVYKPLANKYIKGGSILIKDQFGETIAFSKEAYTALEIVIRKRIVA